MPSHSPCLVASVLGSHCPRSLVAKSAYMFSELFGLYSTCCQLTKLLLFTANEFWTQLTKWRKWEVKHPIFAFINPLWPHNMCVIFVLYFWKNTLCWESTRARVYILQKYDNGGKTVFLRRNLRPRHFNGNVFMRWKFRSAINFLACSLSVSNFNILIRLWGSGAWAHVTEYNLDV